MFGIYLFICLSIHQSIHPSINSLFNIPKTKYFFFWPLQMSICDHDEWQNLRSGVIRCWTMCRYIKDTAVAELWPTSRKICYDLHPWHLSSFSALSFRDRTSSASWVLGNSALTLVTFYQNCTEKENRKGAIAVLLSQP